MRRREFITLLGGAAAVSLARPLVARGQEVGRIYRLGVLNAQGRQAPPFSALFDELQKFGFVEGKNLIVDSRGFAARTEQFSALAVELVKAGVDAIQSGGPAATRAAQDATRTIPIIANINDMLGAGLVASLAQPGGNITGISFLATELDGKRQEILMEVMPSARRMAALADPDTSTPQKLQTLRNGARARGGVDLSIHLVDRPERIVAAIDDAKNQGAAALNVLASPLLNARRFDIFERTALLRMPSMYQWPESAEEGGLIGYGPRLTQVYRQMARQLVKVLRGTKPSEVPVEQPTNFELVINTATAKAIGFEVPPALVLRADNVIE
jgi:putative ABC transport system substrate-binding protein